MAGDGALPGISTDTEDRIVCHVDMDCFYAACERLRDPELEGEPLVVGMGYEDGERHGAVATASYEAREFGVESAQAISQALEQLPRREHASDDADLAREETGYYRPVDMDYYQSVSEDVREVLDANAETVRAVSIDEAYLDVTERTTWDAVEAYARTLKDQIADQIGIVASVGVAPTMSAAKIASDYDKPDGLVVVRPGEVQSFLAPLPVGDVHNVGPVTARELREMGIETAGDLANADPDALVDRFGERGREIYGYARGEDDREVTPVGKPKSLSRESAFSDPVDIESGARERVETLAEAVADRAERKRALYQTIGIKVVTPPFDVHTRAHSLPGPVEDNALVRSIALELLEEFADESIRKVGVRVSNLDFTDRQQAALDDWDAPDADDPDQRERAPDREVETSGQTSLSDFGR